MKNRFFAALLAGVMILGLSGCDLFGSKIEKQTTEPPTESETEVSSEPAVPTTDLTRDILPVDPTDETLTQYTAEAKIIGVTPQGYQIVQQDGLTYVNGVLIVNKTYSLPEDYAPEGLTPACEAAFDALVDAAAEEGLEIYLLSGYRSYETQYNLYYRYVAEDGQEEADTYSARPGHSEHQSGLAIDVNSLSHTFADTPEGIWLAAHAHEFGFIIRYAQEKESITGYIYEPWHIRYVGKPTAQAIYESGLCLEEYFGLRSVYKDPVPTEEPAEDTTEGVG